MTYSTLSDRIVPPRLQSYGVKWSARPKDVKINGVIPHHWATTTMAGYDALINSSAQKSANYLILDDGDIIGSVDERYRAWTTGSFAADDDKITIEIQNHTGSPTWTISDAAMTSLEELYADIASRYGFKPDRAHISGHRDYEATACPGDYLYYRLGTVAAHATDIVESLGEKDVSETLRRVRWIMSAIGGTNKKDSVRARLSRMEARQKIMNAKLDKMIKAQEEA